VNRRRFLAIAGSGILSAPLAAEAQPAGKVYRIGVISSGINPRSASFFQAFERQLRDHGWVEGTNLAIDYRTPRGPTDFAVAAADLVRANVDVILAGGPDASLRAAKHATATIPIVIVALNYDPVEKGYVASLARPGGNVTGVFSRAPEVGAKALELLREIRPGGTVVGVFWEAFTTDQLPMIDTRARELHVQLEKVEVRPPYDYERAFLTLKRRPVGAVLIVGSPVFFRDRARIAELALQHGLPAGGLVGGADVGMLLSFGVHPNIPYGRAADYVDRILRGAKAADLPVEEISRFELVINLKTAKALGLTIPPSLLQRADQVIE
jgi:putative tryptophan/tyrosine transport system substrate-binding protein